MAVEFGFVFDSIYTTQFIEPSNRMNEVAYGNNTNASNDKIYETTGIQSKREMRQF